MKKEKLQIKTEYVEFTFPIQRDIKLAAVGIARHHFSGNFYCTPTSHNIYEIREDSRRTSDPADIIVINSEENQLVVKINKALLRADLERQINQVQNKLSFSGGKK